MSQLDKSRLRRQILQQRQSLSPLEWQTRSRAVSDRLRSHHLFEKAHTILAYFSFRQEVDLTPIFTQNKHWAFPRCVGKSLVWHSWQPSENLKSGKYGIKEPLTSSPIIDPGRADLILVPTVAADQRGYRLGYGGGFYDRLLSSSACSKIPTIGIVFDFTYKQQLPTDSWDVKLNFICTETKFDAY